jgi:hypothetical protein
MHGWTFGRAKVGKRSGVFPGEAGESKKEEFPGIMEIMLPRNSFPQICVVSGNKFVEIAYLTQEYGRSVAKSNPCF